MVPIPRPVQTEGTVEAGLLAYAHCEAMRWGAERFAAEFHRRDEEERRLLAAEARAFGSLGGTGAPAGPVLAETADRVVGPERDPLDLHRPMRHPDVPRPPSHLPVVEPVARRGRRHARDRLVVERAPTITATEAARMSPAARRLYGL